MEEREVSSNNTVSFGLKQHEASSGYHMDPPRLENPNPFSPPSVPAAPPSENAAPPFSLTMPAENESSELKKKRGRPRKYNPDGSLAVTLSPMPISSTVPLTSEFSGRKRGRGRGRGRDREREKPNSNWLKNPQMFEFDKIPVGGTTDLVGGSFTPHVLTVEAGEDVTMKIMTFSQQGSRAICILSANGPISNVTIRQSMTSGGTLTYEGNFEILSLTGSFIVNESGGTRSRAGGMSVSLAGPDGRVFGGGLAGLFIAAGPVQVMVGSFVAGQEERKPQIKKQKRERLSVPTEQPSISFGGSAEDSNARYGINNNKPVIPAPPVSFSHETNTVHSYYGNSANHIKDLFSSLPEEDEEEEDEEDLEGEDDEFGGHSESDNEIPT